MFLGYKLKENPAVGIILIINLFYFLLLELDGGSKNWLTLVAWGAKEGTLISRGEYWRLFSPIFMSIFLFVFSFLESLKLFQQYFLLKDHR